MFLLRICLVGFFGFVLVWGFLGLLVHFAHLIFWDLDLYIRRGIPQELVRCVLYVFVMDWKTFLNAIDVYLFNFLSVQIGSPYKKKTKKNF